MRISERYNQCLIEKKQLLRSGKSHEEDSEFSQKVNDILGYMANSALQCLNRKCILSLHWKSCPSIPVPATIEPLSMSTPLCVQTKSQPDNLVSLPLPYAQIFIFSKYYVSWHHTDTFLEHFQEQWPPPSLEACSNVVTPHYKTFYRHKIMSKQCYCKATHSELRRYHK